MFTSLYLIAQELGELALTAITGLAIFFLPIAACAFVEHLCNTLPPTICGE